MTTVEELTFPSGGIELYGRLRTVDPDRPTVVLLCGLGFHTFEYEPLADWLARRAINTFSFDYRGHGRSSGARGRWTLSDLADDTACALEAVRRRHRGPVVLFGNSLGAMVGLLAAANDSAIAGVVASNCAARVRDVLLTRPRRVLFTLAKAVDPLVRPRISVDHFYAYSQLIDDPSWLRTIESDRTVAEARRLSVRTYRALLDDWDGVRAVTRVHVPLLLVQGEHDRLQPPTQSELLRDATNPSGELRLLPTGHLPHVEATAVVGDLLVRWIDEVLAERHDGAS